MKKGQKVRYIDSKNNVSRGIVKSINESGKAAFVVFNCACNWNDYENYTGILVPINSLLPSWIIRLEDFEKIPDGIVMADGICKNQEDGVFMTNSRIGDDLRWVAVKGYANDWCIYIHWAEFSEKYVISQGEKVLSPDNIKKLCDCDEEVMKLYRK